MLGQKVTKIARSPSYVRCLLFLWLYFRAPPHPATFRNAPPSCPGPRVWIGDWLPTGGFLRLWVVVVVADVIYLPVVLSGISLWLEIDS